MKNCVITIARGFGSGGRTIASAMADQLGIHSYEHRILTLAAQLSGRDEQDFVDVDEKLKGGLIGQVMMELPKRLAPHPEAEKFASNDRLFEFEKEIINRLADTENCIIVGKCADAILRDRDNVISVYIEAPRVFCLERLKGRMNLSDKEANKLIEKTDKYRADYYKYYTHGNYWTNPVNYDLTLNSARLGDDGCIDMIKACMKYKFGEAWYREFMDGIDARREPEKIFG